MWLENSEWPVAWPVPSGGGLGAEPAFRCEPTAFRRGEAGQVPADPTSWNLDLLEGGYNPGGGSTQGTPARLFLYSLWVSLLLQKPVPHS